MDLFNYLHHYLHIGLYSSLFILILIEEIGIPLPVPGDAFLVIFGVLSRSGQTEFLPTLLIILTASLVGGSVLYYLSFYFGRPLVEKYGKYIHMSHSQLDHMEHWMGRYGWWTIFVARLIPTLRIGGSLVAGILQVRYRTYISATMAATIIWTAVYFSIGAYLGKHYGPFVNQLLSNHFFFLGLFFFFLISGLIMVKVVIPLSRHGAKKLAKRS